MADWDRSASPERPPPSSVYLQLGLGIALTFVLHAVVAAVLAGAAVVGAGLWPSGTPAELPIVVLGVWAMSIGIAQLPYVLPAIAVGWIVRKPLGMGLLVGAGLTFLLNSTCYGLVFVSVGLTG